MGQYVPGSLGAVRWQGADPGKGRSCREIGFHFTSLDCGSFCSRGAFLP